MPDRRRFLTVLSASMLSAAAAGACNDELDPQRSNSSGGSGSGGSGPDGVGGDTGTGGSAAGGDGGNAGAGGDPNAMPQDECALGKKIVTVGEPSAYATMGLHKVVNTGVLIGRDENGLFALSSLCQHNCCNMNQPMQVIGNGAFTTGGDITADGGIICYCHNSLYAPDGTVVSGPAKGRLVSLAIGLSSAGKITVDTTMQVAPHIRMSDAGQTQ